MLDIKRYIRLQPQGLAEAAVDGENCMLMFKRFSVETGEEIESEVQSFPITDLIDQRNDFVSQALVIDDILREFKK
jgi:hypothetical protein